ncbi:glycosyl hydrolase [Massilioclostridium coli]|uniref:glycosyl hydrolase n=1 Tax=Massilioclostridium coli TaxID=1870991 RepID=UPI0022E63608|nr:glycosyl hydrolase [Massilioclostridium coli]
MKKKTRIGALCLALAVSASLLVGSMPAVNAAGTSNGFADKLSDKYGSPKIENRTEVRWWMAEGGHTDETLEEEVQAIYDAGFRGIELCQLDVKGLDASIYGYGSEQWDHDFHLVLNKALDLGMTVGLTSGTNWSTANVPGLDPDSQAANQAVFQANETIPAGQSRSGKVPTETITTNSFGGTNKVTLPEKNEFIGAYAYKRIGIETKPIVIDNDSIIDLSDQVSKNDQGDYLLDWTAPDDGDYDIIYYWQVGTAQVSKPAVETSYCINYFDRRGFEALKEYWEEHVLCDEELNAKIKEGDVQLFMDSLEYTTGTGFVNWTEDFAEEFEARKGYDIRPYLFLAIGLPAPKRVSPPSDVYGTYNLEDANLGQRILNDLNDVQTELYMENLMEPFREWLNSYGITLRAQISYGKYLENSEPIQSVDYPEAETLNQENQIEMYRTWSGGSKLQNKILSSETSALGGTSYAYDYQMHLQEAYTLYAAGYSRINWHIWTSQWAPEPVEVDWPGFRSNSSFNVLSLRYPSYSEYDEFNDHLGRVQQLLREGKSRSDVGMVYMKYGMPILAPSQFSKNDENNWLLRHDYMPGYIQTTELQDNGYTYDYFSPDFLDAEGVYYDAENGTLELAGYKALVLWQDWLTLDGAQKILEYAKQGLKVVIVDGAAVQTPYNDGSDSALAEVMSELKTLDCVATAASDDDIVEALQSLDVTPYAGMPENHQLLTQVRQDENGNEYLYAYNYCNGEFCEEDHGTNIKTEISMDGIFIPYVIDAWSGEVTQVANYRYENGKTIFTIDLNYGDVALYAFEKTDTEQLHITDTNADNAYETKDGVVIRTTKSGNYYVTTSDGKTVKFNTEVPNAYDITNWDVTVEKWSKGEEIFRTETLDGVTTTEHTFNTVKTDVDVKLDSLTTWDNIPEVGKEVSGKGYYSATFDWNGNADGAYIDFGDMVMSMTVSINGQQVSDLNMNDAKLDISDYLQVGKNTIQLEYSSNLNNAAIAIGALNVTEEGKWVSWPGYRVDYCSYGPAQAVIVPYNEVSLEEIQADKGILNSVIQYAEAAKESDEYDNAIESVQKSFDAALENAKTVANNAGATQEEVNAAWKTLLNEIHKLGFVAGDKTELASLIEAANEINAELDRYVEAGKAEFTAALEAAVAVYEDGDAMQAEVNEAADNLLNAMLNLRYKADKSILEEVLAEASKVDANAYTAESYAALQAAVAEANDVYNNENATQEEVDAAVTSVQTAIDNLVAVDGTPAETPTEDVAQTGQESTTPKANAAKTGDFAPIAGMAAIAVTGAALLLTRKKK